MPGEQREGGVEELERGALGGLDGLGDLEEFQVDRLVGPEQLAGGDPEQQRIADLPGGAGDGDGCGHSVEIDVYASDSSAEPRVIARIACHHPD